MLTINLQGGLGNQLFQIITLIAHSIECKTNIILEHKKSLPGQYVVRSVYWDNLFSTLKDKLTQEGINWLQYNEPAFHYNKIPVFQSNTKLNGYFQSWKYFDKYKKGIFDNLQFNDMKQKLVNYKVKDSIALHFRVGDYIKLQQYHPLMTTEYYIDAIRIIVDKTKKDDWNIIYFCEENDINYVVEKVKEIKKHFPNINFIKVDSKLDDWEQLLLMSLCDHNIIANSSFSWWGAYLNDNNPIVVYPPTWFGPAMSSTNTKDLFPNNWMVTCNHANIVSKNYILNNIYYINLQERIDRRIQVESELNNLGWKYERFNAIRLKNPRVGCSMSHLKLLEKAKKENMDYIVILEDDIMFTKPENFNNNLKLFLDSNIDYDVLLLAGNLRAPFSKISNFCLKITKAWTTTGYIVKKHYYDKLINNIKEGIKNLMANPDYHHLYAIDANWQKLQAVDNWFIIYPRTVTQRPNFSTIENRYTDYNHLMLD